MRKETIKYLIKEFYESTLPDLVERHQQLDYSVLDSRVCKVIVILGPRRAGKTYFLFQVIKQLQAQGKEKEEMLYLNF